MDTTNKIYDLVNVDQDYFFNNEEEKEVFYTKASVLPRNIFEVLFNEETPSQVKNITDQFQLNIKQIEELSRLIRKILVTEIYLGDIVQEITNRLAVSPNIAKEIANRVITNLFAPAIEDLKKLHTEKFPGKAPTPPSPSQNSGSSPSATTTPKQDQTINPNNVLDLRK